MRLFTPIFGGLICFFLACVVGCTKGPYVDVGVDCYALFGNDLYILIRKEVGVNKESRFGEGNGFQPSGIALVLARCSLDQNNSASLKVVGKLHIDHKRFENSYIFSICSTNTILALNEGNTYDVMSFAATPRYDGTPWLSAQRLVFNTDRSLIFGYGTKPWVVDAGTLRSPSGNYSNALAVICGNLNNRNKIKVAVSDDARTIAVEDWGENWPANNDKPKMTVIQLGHTPSKSQFIDSDYSLDLQYIYGGRADTKMLFTTLVQYGTNMMDIKKYAVLCNASGKELARTEINGDVVSDGSLSKIISVSRTEAMSLNPGERLPVKVWLPKQNKEYVIFMDASEVLKALSAALKDNLAK